jgi:acetate kinase
MNGLDRRSGLLGLAGSADMREVIAAAARREPAATLALDIYVHRLVGLVAAMAAALGGLDALVFTGGVGEHAPVIRARAVQRLAFLGVGLDQTANENGPADREIGRPRNPVRTFVVEAREDLEIARGVRSLFG